MSKTAEKLHQTLPPVAETVKGPGKSRLKLILLVAALALVVVFTTVLDGKALLQDLLAWIENQGSLGVAVFIFAYIAATILFLPGSVLTLGAGAVFGVVWGTVYVSIASTIGATCAFLIGRYFAREMISGKIAGNEKFNAVDDAVAKEGWKIVFLTRLSPIFPFNILNYSFGITKVSLLHFTAASWIGMLPGTVMYVYLGGLAGELARLGAEQRQRSAYEWGLYVVGLLATVAVTIYVTKVAKQALNSKVANL